MATLVHFDDGVDLVNVDVCVQKAQGQAKDVAPFRVRLPQFFLPAFWRWPAVKTPACRWPQLGIGRYGPSLTCRLIDRSSQIERPRDDVGCDRRFFTTFLPRAGPLVRHDNKIVRVDVAMNQALVMDVAEP